MRRASLTLLCSAPLALLAATGCGGDDGDGNRFPGPDATEDGRDGGIVDGGNGDGGGTDARPIDAAIDAPQPQQLAVCAGGGAPFTAIGDAIAAANPGSTIRVCPGTYREALVIDGKPIILVSDGGAAVTFLDGGDTATPLTVRATGGAGVPGVSVTGFTIQHGRSTVEGGGVRCEASALAIADSVIDSNVAERGGGLYAAECALDLQRTRVARNTGGTAGGGAAIIGSTGTIADGAFVENRASLGAGVYQADLVAGTMPPSIVASDVSLLRNDISANVGHRGGGIYQDSSATIMGNRIADNVVDWTGGGVFIVAHAPMIVTNRITGNQSPNDGGGVYLHQSSARLEANEVLENVSGDDGGGIRVFESPAMLVANIVERNEAGDGGGGIRVSHVPATLLDNVVRENHAGGTGGGMDLDNDSSLVRGGVIADNRAGGSGGGIFAWLGPWNGHRIEDVTISGNRAWQGGAIYLVDNFQPVQLRRLRVTGNRAAKGGAIMVSSTDFTITGSLFADNTGTERGGAIFAGASAPWLGLDGVSGMCPCPPANPTGRIDFTVMARNVSPHGAAVWSAFPSLSIDGSILHAHAGAAIEATTEGPPPAMPEDPPLPPPPPPALHYSDVYPAMFAGMNDPTGVDGNLAVDCLFADAAAGDFHLLPGSPCIDAAAPNLVDADGTRADMGMFGGSP